MRSLADICLFVFFTLLLFVLVLIAIVGLGSARTTGHLRIDNPKPCSHDEYNREDYGYDPAKQRSILPLYLPYTHRIPDRRKGLEVEHIVALQEAHISGMCGKSAIEKSRFAQDLLNQTLATEAVNRAKSSLDIAHWRPDGRDGTSDVNLRWFANRIILVKTKYRLTVDPIEMHVLKSIMEGRSANP